MAASEKALAAKAMRKVGVAIFVLIPLLLVIEQ
jgi:hypothetical protein